MSDASIVCSNLSFAWPDDTPAVHRLVLHRRRRPHRPGRAERCRQEHAAAADRRRVPAQRRHRHRRRDRSATCRRRCRSMPTAASPTCWVSRPVIDALDALAAGDAGEERLRRDRRRLGHRGAPARATRPPGSRRPRAGPAAGLAVRWRSRLGRAGRATAQAPRRAAARRTDQQPRPRRAPQALRRTRRLQGLPAAGQPRPGSAGPDGPHRRAAPWRNPVLRRQFQRIR